eukprot:8393405-Prorocentrum_lima.AAC.1
MVWAQRHPLRSVASRGSRTTRYTHEVDDLLGRVTERQAPWFDVGVSNGAGVPLTGSKDCHQNCWRAQAL